MIERLDHLNIRTARLKEMIAWYGRMLDMHPGPRPNFDVGGAWLYAKGHPLVHLVETTAEPVADASDLKLEHGAFSATGFDAFVQKFRDAGERTEIIKVPGFPIVQVNVWDADGNHLHIDFDAAECGDYGQD